jgi:hypothetical protein
LHEEIAMTWQPLLEDALQDRVLEAVQAIVEHVVTRGPELGDDHSLAGGTTGLAILHAYATLTGCQDQAHAAVAVRCLEHAVAAMRSNAAQASLYDGLTGVGWAIAHLDGRLPGLDRTDDLAEIDDILLDHLDQPSWPGPYNLCDGLVGFGVYALERLPRPAAVACLKRVIDRLAETAEHRSDGITWASKTAWLVPHLREERPRPYYDLGLPHGVPGVIALLGRASASNVAADKARPLLEGAVRWLLSRQPADSKTGFPGHIGPGIAPVPATPEWSYGDPGVAAALLGAAHAVGEPSWEHAALTIARRTCLPRCPQVFQANLYHGASGLGHLYNRMFQATGKLWLKEAAEFWFRRTLEMRSPQGKSAGFYTWGPGPKGSPRTWIDNPRFLTGTAGIALALLAAATPVEPSWDRVLLVSIPPRIGQASQPDGRIAGKEKLQCQPR